jgi:hypothetical protein
VSKKSVDNVVFTLFFFFFREVNAQVLIVVEVMDHYTSAQGRKEAQLQIRFPNSAAIAAECKSKKCHRQSLTYPPSARHGDRDNNFAHREIFFTAKLEGLYKYCMRDLPISDHNSDAVDTALLDEEADAVDALHTRRARLEVRSRFKTAPSQAHVECFATTATDCDLPPVPEVAKPAEL